MAGRKKSREQEGREEANRAADAEYDFATGETSRAVPGTDSTKEERIAYIVGEMSALRWNGYETRLPLTWAWGVGDSAIRAYAAEASRSLAIDPEEREAHRQALAKWVGLQRERASRMVNTVTGLPDFSAVFKGAELEAKLSKIELDNRKVELTGKDGGPIMAGLAPIIMIPPERADDDDSSKLEVEEAAPAGLETEPGASD